MMPRFLFPLLLSISCISALAQDADPQIVKLECYIRGAQVLLFIAPSDAPETMTLGCYDAAEFKPGPTAKPNSTSDGWTNLAHLESCDDSMFAAKYCDELVAGGYDDWYLPARDELDCIYMYKDTVKGLNYQEYWTSSVLPEGFCWFQEFEQGFKFQAPRSKLAGVRCVRTDH